MEISWADTNGSGGCKSYDASEFIQARLSNIFPVVLEYLSLECKSPQFEILW